MVHNLLSSDLCINLLKVKERATMDFEKFIHKDGGMRLCIIATYCGYVDVERLPTLSGGRVAAPTSHVVVNYDL